jgi:hypothetical protein
VENMSSRRLALTTKTKPAPMSTEVRAMIDVRHQAEQRGHYEPLGRLLWMSTAHGTIKWPVEDGEAQGPDVATADIIEHPTDTTAYLMLGPWQNLPPVRVHSETPCPKCRHACDVCDGGGKKQCEMVGCGGTGWVPGPFELCPAPNCSAQTGKINPDGCTKCRNSGQVPIELACPMCQGSKMMTCPRCKGSGNISTGQAGGSLDWKAEKCAACEGTGLKGAWEAQDAAKFTNAQIDAYRVLGPVFAFCISDYRSRKTRVFDVALDAAGDLLNLLVPNRHARGRNKAYLVGGVVRERVGQAGQVA